MSREIKFRGKCKDTGVWLYGALVDHLWTYSELSETPGKPVVNIIIVGEAQDWNEVEYLSGTVFAESVGQFIGRKDKNGKEIYEGDILLDQYKDKMEDGGIGKIYYPVVFQNGCFGWVGENSGQFYNFHDNPIPDTTIAGNIFENPELIKS